MRKIQLIIFLTLATCSACSLNHDTATETTKAQNAFEDTFSIKRFDKLEIRFLSSGDFVALHDMNTIYPTQTRNLVEEILRIGEMDSPNINTKILTYFKDSTLQRMIKDVQKEFRNTADIDSEINHGFATLKNLLPGVEHPNIYTQVGAFDESILVNGKDIGVSLDKYLGYSYPLYEEYYTLEQRKMMTRKYIAGDCICGYLLSKYPIPTFYKTQALMDHHRGKIQWIANKALHKMLYKNEHVEAINQVMQNQNIKIVDLLKRPLI